ncbi:9320_t:CDS:2 [Rhizophagus irregularis]|nr:9320_t:CDS:2 [Rhizophagus irregularis]
MSTKPQHEWLSENMISEHLCFNLEYIMSVFQKKVKYHTPISKHMPIDLVIMYCIPWSGNSGNRVVGRSQ